MKDNGAFSFRVELSMSCPRCDNPVPVDGPVGRVWCPHCGGTVEIERSYWIEQLGEAVDEMRNTPVGEGTGSMFFGTNRGNLTLGRLDPYCDSCKTDFANPWDLEAGVYTCSSCGARWPVSPPPSWLSQAVPSILQLINAVLEREGEGTAAPAYSEPVSLSCPSCSGNLELDGSSRLVRCGYCGSQVYLPDSVWMKLHGGRRKRRWFVVCSS